MLFLTTTTSAYVTRLLTSN